MCAALRTERSRSATMPPPTLREVLALAAAKPGVRINCDLKERGLEPAVAALAAECGMAGRLIFSGSVDVNIFAAHPELHDCAEVYLNIEEYVPDLYLNYRNIPDFELTAAEIITKVCREHGIATVNMNQVLITRRFIETLKDSGIALSAWTVNEEIFSARALSPRPAVVGSMNTLSTVRQSVASCTGFSIMPARQLHTAPQLVSAFTSRRSALTTALTMPTQNHGFLILTFQFMPVPPPVRRSAGPPRAPVPRARRIPVRA